MEGREILKKMILGYPLIYGGVMMATWLCSLIYRPNAMFGVNYFGWMFLVALVGDLPMLIFYSKGKMTKQQWNIRTILHALVLMLVMLGAGYFLGFYANFKEGIIFMATVIGVYLMVSGLSLASDIIEVNQINEKLKNIKE